MGNDHRWNIVYKDNRKSSYNNPKEGDNHA